MSETQETSKNGSTKKGEVDGSNAADTRSQEAEKKEATKRLTMADLAGGYIKHLEDIGKSHGTIFSYGQDLRLAVEELGEKTNVKSLTAKKMQAFFDSDRVTQTKAGRGKAVPTIAKTRRVLRLALTWAVETGLIDKAPLPEPASKN